MENLIEPKVIVLLLNYNRGIDTVECINTIKSNAYKNYSILVIDNNSTDNSINEIKANYPKVEVINSGENLGYTGGINYGIKIAKNRNPDYLLLLNNDTLVEKDFLIKLVSNLEKNKDAAMATGSIFCEHDKEQIWYAGGKIIHWRALAVHKKKGESKTSIPVIEEPRYTEFASGCMMLLRMEYLERIGLQDERFFMYLDDIEYSMRITAQGYKILYVPNSIIYHKVFGEKESAFKLYYSVRNRLLLINSSFTGFNYILSKIYFVFVILVKLIYWSFKKPAFRKSAFYGIQDYFRGEYGQGRGKYFINC